MVPRYPYDLCETGPPKLKFLDFYFCKRLVVVWWCLVVTFYRLVVIQIVVIYNYFLSVKLAPPKHIFANNYT